MKKEKTFEVILVLVVGLMLVYFIYQIEIILYISFGLGVIGIFIKRLAELIAKAWFKLGDLLGYVVSKIVLSVMFYLLLIPIAFLHNLFNKDKLGIKRTEKSLWSERNLHYTSSDLKNIW